MGCCDDKQIHRLPDMEGLPDVTYQCMARLAYLMLCMSEHHYTGRPLMGWDGLSEEMRQAYVTQVRQAPVGVIAPANQLFYNFVRALMTAV